MTNRNNEKQGISKECPVCGEKPIRESYYKIKDTIGPRTIPNEAVTRCIHFRENDQIHPIAIYYH